MIRKSTISILLLAGGAFLGGLLGSLKARAVDQQDRPEPAVPKPACDPVAGMLGLDESRRARIKAADPDFRQDLADLRQDLGQRRQALTDLLENAESSDDAIRGAVEDIIAAHNALERRVAEHLLSIRHELTPAQQKKLFSRLAEGVRKMHGRKWGRGRGGRDGMERGGRWERGGREGRSERGWHRGHRRGGPEDGPSPAGRQEPES